MLKKTLKKKVRDWCDKEYPKKIDVKVKPDHNLGNRHSITTANHVIGVVVALLRL